MMIKEMEKLEIEMLWQSVEKGLRKYREDSAVDFFSPRSENPLVS